MGGRAIRGDVGWSLLSAVVLVGVFYVLLMFALGRFQLTNWLGYLLFVSGGFKAIRALIETSWWVAAAAIPLTIAVALFRVPATVKAFHADPDMVPDGFIHLPGPWTAKGIDRINHPRPAGPASA